MRLKAEIMLTEEKPKPERSRPPQIKAERDGVPRCWKNLSETRAPEAHDKARAAAAIVNVGDSSVGPLSRKRRTKISVQIFS